MSSNLEIHRVIHRFWQTDRIKINQSIKNKSQNEKTYKYTKRYSKRYETTNYTVLSLLECKNFSRSTEYTVRLIAASDEKSVLAGSLSSILAKFYKTKNSFGCYKSFAICIVYKYDLWCYCYWTESNRKTLTMLNQKRFYNRRSRNIFFKSYYY